MDPKLRKTTSATDLSRPGVSPVERTIGPRRRVNSSRDGDGCPTWLRPFELTPDGSKEEPANSRFDITSAVFLGRASPSSPRAAGHPPVTPKYELNFVPNHANTSSQHVAIKTMSPHALETTRMNGPSILAKRHGIIDSIPLRLPSPANQKASAFDESHSLPSTPVKMQQSANMSSDHTDSSPLSRKGSAISDTSTSSGDSLADLTEELADCTGESSIVRHARWTRITCESPRACGGLPRASPRASPSASPRDKQAHREAALIPRRSREQLGSPIGSPGSNAARVPNGKEQHHQGDLEEARSTAERTQSTIGADANDEQPVNSSRRISTPRSSGSLAEIARQRVQERARLRESLLAPHIAAIRERMESLQSGSPSSHPSSSSRATSLRESLPDLGASASSDYDHPSRAPSSLDGLAAAPLPPGARPTFGPNVLGLSDLDPTHSSAILRTTQSSDALNPRAAAIAALTRHENHSINSIQHAFGRARATGVHRGLVDRSITSSPDPLPTSSHGLEGAFKEKQLDGEPKQPLIPAALHPRGSDSSSADSSAAVHHEQQGEQSRGHPTQPEPIAKGTSSSRPTDGGAGAASQHADRAPGGQEPSPNTSRRGDASAKHRSHQVGLGILVEGVALGSPEQIKPSKQEVRPGYFARLRTKASSSQMSDTQTNAPPQSPVRDDVTAPKAGYDAPPKTESAPIISSLASSALGAVSSVGRGLAFPGSQSTESLIAPAALSTAGSASRYSEPTSSTGSKFRWWQRRRQSSKPAAPSQTTPGSSLPSPLRSAPPLSLATDPVRQGSGDAKNPSSAEEAQRQNTRSDEATPSSSPPTSFRTKSLWGRPAARERGPILPLARQRHASFTSTSTAEARAPRSRARMSINMSIAGHRGQTELPPSPAKQNV